jgi:hypothetical protein
MYGDCLDAHLTTRALNAQSNFAAIGYYDFVEHVEIARLVDLPLIDDNQCLAILDRLTVLYAYRLHNPGNVSVDLIHHLHRFDDA